MKKLLIAVQSVLSVLGEHKKSVQRGYIAAFFEAGMSFVPFLLLFYVIKVGLSRDFTRNDFVIVLVAMIVSVILRAFFKRKQDILQQNKGLYAFTENRLHLADHLSKLNMGYYNEGNIGNISSVVSTDISFIEEFALTQLGIVVSTVMNWLLSLIFVFVFNIPLGIAYFVLSLIGLVGLTFLVNAMESGTRTRQDNFGHLSQSIITYVRGMQTIKAFNMTREKNADIESVIDKVQADSLQFVRKASASIVIFNVFAFVPTGVLIYVILHLIQRNALDLTFGIGFIVFSFVLFMPVILLGNSAEILAVAKKCVDRYKEILAEEPISDLSNNKTIKEMRIAFKDVSFSYGQEAVLKQINLKIEPHTFTALVGESGSGKTTITNLIARFWDVDEGEILIDGENIKTYPLPELMDNISMVFQDVYLFNDTIYNNVAFGNPDAGKEEVIAACQKARCHDFIMKLEKGYDTIIGEGGSSLSGGEKQRLSIARAILKDAKLILLDEATAGIDPENEKFIQEAIEALVKDKTLIVIAHRLSTIQNADQIVVLKDGEIVEKGSQNELLQQDGPYKRQYDFYRKIREY